MFFNYLTHPLVVAALISFFAGSFGYVIAVLVLRPLLAYHMLRREISNALNNLATSPDTGGGPVFNRLAIKMTAVYNEQLPQWYKMALTGRGVQPLSAARDLARLAKTRDGLQALERIAAIRSMLHLK